MKILIQMQLTGEQFLLIFGRRIYHQKLMQMVQEWVLMDIAVAERRRQSVDTSPFLSPLNYHGSDPA